MIDGVKIDCTNCHNLNWQNNKYLKFYTNVNIHTGELLDNTQIAKYKGLKFFITQSTKYKNKTYYSVRGSLHKYFNKGKHNANDFTIDDLQTVINELQQKFNIEPTRATIHNLEFGVNIYTPVPVKEVLKGLVSYGSYTFGTLKIEGVPVGKVLQKQQTNTKIYDKAKQNQKPINNLLRFEIAVKKMIYLKSYGITTLSDLQDKDKIRPLGALLVSVWNDIIYYDKNINWKQLTEFERKKILYYATPRNWNEFSIKQRYRAKKHFNKLLKEFSTSTTHTKISNLIEQKCKQLNENICPLINHDLSKKIDDISNVKCPQINRYNTQLKCGHFNPQKSQFKKEPKNTQKKPLKKCKVCATDISQKKQGTKFCSKKCNNKYHGQKRTQKRQFRILTEKANLQKLVKILDKNRLLLLVTYKTTTGTYSDNLEQYEIDTTPNWIKQITSVSVTGHRKNSKAIILNSYRARKLIKIINQINLNK